MLVKRRTHGGTGSLMVTCCFAAMLAAGGCKNANEVAGPAPCAAVAAPACTLHDGGIDASFAPCIQDECSLATLNAIITIELQAANAGVAAASRAEVKSAAARMATDFAAQQANLTALEAQLAIKEAACDE